MPRPLKRPAAPPTQATRASVESSPPSSSSATLHGGANGNEWSYDPQTCLFEKTWCQSYQDWHFDAELGKKRKVVWKCVSVDKLVKSGHASYQEIWEWAWVDPPSQTKAKKAN